MLISVEHPGPAETANSLTRSQRDALRVIALFRRLRKAVKGWVVGNKRLSQKLVERLEMMDLVEERFVGGHAPLPA